MFITPAWAQTLTETGAGAAEEGSLLMSLLPLFLILLVFYFMVFRPQSKRIKAHQELVEGLKKGDRVVTGGGLIGKVHKLVGEDEIIVELADGVRVHAVRSTVLTKRDKAPAGKFANDSKDASETDDKAITVSRVRKNKKKADGA